jgi:hypothetical protein
MMMPASSAVKPRLSKLDSVSPSMMSRLKTLLYLPPDVELRLCRLHVCAFKPIYTVY